MSKMQLGSSFNSAVQSVHGRLYENWMAGSLEEEVYVQDTFLSKITHVGISIKSCLNCCLSWDGFSFLLVIVKTLCSISKWIAIFVIVC